VQRPAGEVLPPDPDAGPVRVVAVDAFSARRRILCAALQAGSFVDVVGQAAGGREAMELVAQLAPAVVVLDLDLPEGDGPAGPGLVAALMARCPTPVVAHVSEGPHGRLLAHAALGAGAVAVLTRPAIGGAPAITRFADQLLECVQAASRAPHPIAAPLDTTVLNKNGNHHGYVQYDKDMPRPPQRSADVPARSATASSARWLPTPRSVARLVVIGASTGGPAAIAAVLTTLPADLAVPVLVVQHIATGFLAGFASWLDGVVALSVRVGASGESLLPGEVVLAPEGRNALIDKRLRLITRAPAPGQLHVPGVDATFCSAADTLGASVIGVLLTGMGRDGAAGLARLRTVGAVTLAQDEKTSAVFGMPAAARELDAVEWMLPLPHIGPAIAALAAPEAVAGPAEPGAAT
jgi:two-component system chemotaxis response regulator CheB